MSVNYTSTNATLFNTSITGGKLIFHDSAESFDDYGSGSSQETKIWNMPVDSGTDNSTYAKFRIISKLYVNNGNTGTSISYTFNIGVGTYNGSTYTKISSAWSNNITLSTNTSTYNSSTGYYYLDVTLPISTWSSATKLYTQLRSVTNKTFSKPSSGVPTVYTLTISQGDNIDSITVSRVSGYGTYGTLSSGAVIYNGDGLTVAVTASSGYKATGYDASITVSGDVTVSPYGIISSDNAYTLNIVQNNKINNIIVTRVSSNYSTVSLGQLSSGDTIYLGDTITISATCTDDNYRISFMNGLYAPYEITGDLLVAPTVKIKESYSSFIWNGSTWES